MDILRGSTAIITGGSMGLGVCIAEALAEQGIHLVLAARSQELLQQQAQRIESIWKVPVLAVPTDVTSLNDLQHLVDKTLEKFQRIDLLINNAGIESYYPFEMVAPEDLVRTINTNLTAALLLSRLCIPTMLQQKRGQIVNISSTAGKHGPAFGPAYGASKAGMIAMTESLRSEFHGTGVSSSVICPGFASSGGIYDRLKNELGEGTPFLMGETSGKKVAQAVLKAILQDRPELIVNWPPMRPVFSLCELFPRLGEILIRIGSFRFLKKVAKSRVKNAHS